MQILLKMIRIKFDLFFFFVFVFFGFVLFLICFFFFFFFFVLETFYVWGEKNGVVGNNRFFELTKLMDPLLVLVFPIILWKM